ncbi:unnamed protein product [Pocillopora meandrina]|uniref:Uncharacterized protein n=1 Tax=Pocillopora meandrina TaxID=46732 RepID=A0AAU9VUR2_9CNID|nr:unnamed protein product [Pocillopora meandrina]
MPDSCVSKEVSYSLSANLQGRTPKKFRDEEEAGNLEMMKMNIRRRLEEAKREQQYRREICLQARELRCGMEQKK